MRFESSPPGPVSRCGSTAERVRYHRRFILGHLHQPDLPREHNSIERPMRRLRILPGSNPGGPAYSGLLARDWWRQNTGLACAYPAVNLFSGVP